MLFLLILGTSFLSFGQEPSPSKPKVGLVLSGGGAKGYAHIGVIRKLEEHGIVPDYITGTSMGSIIGALYSIGYTPDQMEQIIEDVNWDEVISNKVGYEKISFEEKYYYGRYLIDLPADDWVVRLPTALIEGQNLHLLLSRLTEPVHGIRDFSEFPIPFKCVGADIERGTPVVLDTGDIVQAIRASMAIPTVFTPVAWDSLLLVDGGLVRNYPVKEVKDMGADIIIGSYVGSGFKTKEELRSLVDILSQAAFVTSIFDSEAQTEMVDIHMVPDLAGYTAADFTEGAPIIQRGYEAAEKSEAQIKSLAERLGVEGDTIKRPGVTLLPAYRFEDIVVEGNKTYPDKLIKGRMKVKVGQEYSLERLEEELNLAFGIQSFKEVSYRILPGLTDSTYVLNLKVKEAARNSIRAGLHYDTENNVGLSLNYTSRNAILRGSRFLVEADIADNPRVSTNYFKYLGKQQKIAFYVGYYFNSFRRFPFYENTSRTATFDYNMNRFDVGIQTTHLRNATFGFRGQFQRLDIDPRVNQDSAAIQSYNEKATQVELYLSVNTTNHAYFPTRGERMNIRVRSKLSTEADFATTGVIDSLSVFGDYTTVVFDLDSYISFFKKFTLTYGGMIGLSFRNDSIDLSPQIMDYQILGGFNPVLPNSYRFIGLPAYSQLTPISSSVYAGIQYRFLNHFVAQGFINYANNEWFEDVFNVEGIPEYNTGGKNIFGIGGMLNYETVIGPASLGIATNSKDPTYYVYFGVGFMFGKYL